MSKHLAAQNNERINNDLLNVRTLNQELDTNSSDAFFILQNGPRLQEFKFGGLDNLGG